MNYKYLKKSKLCYPTPKINPKAATDKVNNNIKLVIVK